MTTYDPQPIVTVEGVDYTSDTINFVQITAGRATIDEQPRAGYATISLLVIDGTYPIITLNSTVKVSIVDSNGVDPYIFTGYITDINRSIVAHGVTGTVVQIDLIVAGPLARLAKLQTEASYPKQNDGDRIAAILGDVFSTSWDEITPSTLAWNAVDPAKTWLTYDPGFVGTVATPGVYELYDYAGGEVEALSLCTNVANSALGILYEDGDGLINYDTATTRQDNVAANGFTSISSDYLTAVGTASSSRIADVINQITITYKANASYTGSDPNSIATYGLFAANRSTYLEKAADAQQQAELFLETRSIPRVNLAAINVPLHNPALPDATRDALIGVYCGFPIAVPDVPTSIYNHPFTGYVEGYVWRITQHTADLTMTLSDYGLTALEQAWQQVNAAETWNTISATLEWQDARTVA